MRMKKNFLWILSTPLSKRWSFSHQIKLVGSTLRSKGLNVIYAQAPTIFEIESIIKKKYISFIMLHGYPDMFPFLFEEIDLKVPVFLWAQTSGELLAGRYNEIRIKNLHLIPITPLSRQFFEKIGFPRITEVIPHMVDIDAFHPLSKKNRRSIRNFLGLNAKFIFGKVAINCSRKRLKDLITIYAELKSKISSSALILKTMRISQDGEDLGNVARTLGVEKEVVFIEDYLAKTSLNKIYNSLDLYCNISEWEGFGLTVAEAMAAGIPVLAHSTQGPGEYVPYKEFLVASTGLEEIGGSKIGTVDKEEFKKKLFFAYRNPEVLDAFSKKGYHYVLENFSPGVVANKFLQLTCKFN